MTVADKLRTKGVTEKDASVVIGGTGYDLPMRKGTLGPNVVDIGALGDDQSHAAGGPSGVVVRHVPARYTVRGELPGHGRHGDAVAGGEPADRERAREGICCTARVLVRHIKYCSSSRQVHPSPTFACRIGIPAPVRCGQGLLGLPPLGGGARASWPAGPCC